MATRKFKILVSRAQSGPWTEALGDTDLEDARQQQDPLPIQQFSFSTSHEIRFIRFQILSFWGTGGGLQYFELQYFGKN